MLGHRHGITAEGSQALPAMGPLSMDRLQAAGSGVLGAFRLVGGAVEGAHRLPDEAGPGQLGPAALHRAGSLQGHHPGHRNTSIRDHHLLSRPNPGEELAEAGLELADGCSDGGHVCIL